MSTRIFFMFQIYYLLRMNFKLNFVKQEVKMRLCTTSQMKNLDRLTIEKYGIPGDVLMERAGRWVALVAVNLIESDIMKRIVVLAGRGNNGGDGWVAARYLRKAGFNVSVVLVADPDKLAGDAKLNFERALESGVEWLRFEDEIPEADLYIDALLGTGITGAPRGEIAKAIEKLNTKTKKDKSFIIAVDIPSGVNTDDGSAPDPVVDAYATVTFGFPKLGQFIHPGRGKVGKLYVADIGLSAKAMDETPVTFELSTLLEMRKLLPVRPPDGHKGTFGKGLIIGGSAGMTGAVVMASKAFLRSGAGLCYAAVPRSLVDVVDAGAVETVVLPMPEVRKKRCHTLRALGELHKVVENVDVIAIGPGLGRHHETTEMVRRFLVRLTKPVVIDADALNALAGYKDDIIPRIIAPSVMTPHFGELSRILEMPIDTIKSERFIRAGEWAKYLFTVLVVKGNPTLIAAEGKPVWINPTGNDGMATGGSGDALTGLIAGFMAQGLSPFDAAKLGAFVHGLAGDIAAEYYGRRSMTAMDIVEAIPDAILADLELETLTEKEYSSEFDFSYEKTKLFEGCYYLSAEF